MKGALLLCFALAAQCTTEPKPAPGPVPQPEPPAAGSCATACERLVELHCPEGDPTAEGATCESVCRNASDNGTPLPVACVTGADSCEAAAECE